MIEPIMFFGIGFLVAACSGCARSARAQPRRAADHAAAGGATPLSMAEIQADKDQLRAEFAMSTRRLEMSVEQMKAKTHEPARRTRQEDRRHQPAQDRARREDRRDVRARSAREGARGPVARHRGGIRAQDRRAARSRAHARRQAGRTRQADRRARRALASLPTASASSSWRCAPRSRR